MQPASVWINIVKGRVPALLPIIGRAVICDGESAVEIGKVKHQRVLRSVLLVSALLPIGFVSKLGVLFTI